MIPASEHKTCSDYVQETIPFLNYRIQQFVIACMAARDNSVVPAKYKLRPETFPQCLPYVWIYEYDRGRRDYICRLAGERAQNAMNRRMVGLGLMDVVAPEHYHLTMDRWRQAADTPACAYGAYELTDVFGKTGRSERLFMPMQSRDGSRNFMAGISVYTIGDSDGPVPSLPEGEVVFFPLAAFPA